MVKTIFGLRVETGTDVDIFNIIQKVQDTVIHLEVDEEQWEVTHGSKSQAERIGFLAQYLSGLLLHASITEHFRYYAMHVLGQ